MDSAMSNINILILAFLSGLATLIGVFLGNCTRRNDQNIAFGTAFAAGIMVLISSFELIPDSYRIISTKAFFWVLAGFLIVWLINKVLPHIHSVKAIEDCDQQCLIKLSYLLAIGLILHDFPEGFAIPSSFESSAGLGLLLVTATFIHNIPEGYVLTVASAKHKNRGFLYKSALYSALATMSGAVLGMLLVNIFNFLNPIFLSIAAGAMLFISFHELIPTSLKNGRKAVFATGGGLSIIIYLLINILF